MKNRRPPLNFEKRDILRYQLAVDIGGTFTDCVLYDRVSRQLETDKWLTTHDDPSRGVLEGIDRLTEMLSLDPKAVEIVIHATTLAANTVLERKGAVTGLITTAGYRDVLQIGTGTRYDLYDLEIELPAPLVPRHLRYEVEERINASGGIEIPLDVVQVRRAVSQFEAAGVTSIAVCFIHSYINSSHELAAAQIIADERPDIVISLSSSVQPEIREFERTSTTVVNAYIQPIISSYLEALQSGLIDRAFHATLYIMLSSGGITSLKQATQFPVRILESGPAAGVEATKYLGSLIDRSSLVSFDMGGTTAKVGLVTNGRAVVTNQFEAARLHRFKKGSGLIIKSPTVELIEIGAGGGSVAWIDQHGLLKTGPESAGSNPGPACYGRGGARATVTDANMVLGYLHPQDFANVNSSTAIEAARTVVGTIAEELGITLTEAAWGIHEITNENMATAARIHLVEKGQDPAAFALMAFGGAGPVHAHAVARKLGVQEVLIPRNAGVASALGLLVAPQAVDLVRTYIARLDKIDWEIISDLFDDMSDEGKGFLRTDDDTMITGMRTADMRYVGQGSEISVPVPDDMLGSGSSLVLWESFSRTYLQMFGRYFEDLEVQIVNWRLRMSISGSSIQLKSRGVTPQREATGCLDQDREAFFPDSGGFVPVDVYVHDSLNVGESVIGPAIIQSGTSTTVLAPQDMCVVDQYHNLVVNMALNGANQLA